MTIPVTPTMSLNRVCIVDLPGIDVPDNVKGKTAFQLVSATALTRLVRQHIRALHLDANLSDHALRLAYDATLASDTPSVRSAAHEIAQTMGRSLGYVLLALRRGDDVNRRARSEWELHILGSLGADQSGVARGWAGERESRPMHPPLRRPGDA